jgi:hypothetical protein
MPTVHEILSRKPGPDWLTAKQIHFAEYAATARTYSEAYREAYRCDHAKGSTIRTEASRLARNPKIISAIQKIQKRHRFELMGIADALYTLQSAQTPTYQTKAIRSLSKLAS